MSVVLPFLKGKPKLFMPTAFLPMSVQIMPQTGRARARAHTHLVDIDAEKLEPNADITSTTLCDNGTGEIPVTDSNGSSDK